MHWCHLVVQFLACALILSVGILACADAFSKTTLSLYKWRAVVGAEAATMLFFGIAYFVFFWRPKASVTVAEKLQKSTGTSEGKRGRSRGRSTAEQTNVEIAQDEATELMSICGSSSAPKSLVSTLLAVELGSTVFFFVSQAVFSSFSLAIIVFLYTESDRSTGYMAAINKPFDEALTWDYMRTVKLQFLFLQITASIIAVVSLCASAGLRMLTRKVACAV